MYRCFDIKTAIGRSLYVLNCKLDFAPGCLASGVPSIVALGVRAKRSRCETAIPLFDANRKIASTEFRSAPVVADAYCGIRTRASV